MATAEILPAAIASDRIDRGEVHRQIRHRRDPRATVEFE